jgi:phospholipid/cholesterol/gamma-HCH transport system permease protein
MSARFQRSQPVRLWNLNASLAGGLCRIVFRTLTGRPDYAARETWRYVYDFGAKGLPFAAAVSAMLGFSIVYVALGTTHYAHVYEAVLPDAFGRVFVEHIAPLTTAFLVAARSCLAMTAQLGSMRVSQEIDSLEAIGIDPLSLLFGPRALGLLLAAPVLTVFNIYAGLLGGWLGAAVTAQTAFPVFWAGFFRGASSTGLLVALIKILASAWSMVAISGYFGLRVSSAGEGDVGRATTRAVVLSVLAVSVINTVVTLLTPHE